MKSYIIIPARLDSKRLPGKALLDETGMALLEHTYRNAEEAVDGDLIHGIFVAATDQVIVNYCEEKDIEYFDLSNIETKCGSHACMLVGEKLGKCNIINLQLDYPEISYHAIRRIAESLYENTEISSIYYTTNDIDEATDPNNVKVVSDKYHRANYFSRSRIPYSAEEWNIHIGVYGFPFKKWTTLIYQIGMHHKWKGENLEQLEWLYNMYNIMMIKHEKTLGINTREDYEQFKRNSSSR